MRYAAWLIIAGLALAPAFAWYLLGPATTYEWDYGNVTHFIGQVSALVGMTLFSLTFILSTRLKLVEDLFGGLDKVYIAHKYIGGTAFMLLLLHPIFLVLKYVPEHMHLASEYLLISEYDSVNYGIAALIGMIILLIITFYMSVKYQHWKLTHRFMGAVFVLAVIHIFLVRGDIARDNIFEGYNVYAIAVSAIGIAAYLYSLLLKSRKGAYYTVESIDIKGNVHDITLKPDSKGLAAKAGQFFFLSFRKGPVTSEPHPFSVASRKGGQLRVVIKALGDFTSTLKAVKPGQRVWVEGPYGRFNSAAKRQVWIAGGIGITPFLSMAEDLPENGRTVDLYYAVTKRSELIGLEDLQAIARRCKGRFSISTWISDEKGRITIGDIKGSFEGRDFFLCGPAGLKESIKQGLMAKGVSARRIHDEEFRFK